MSESTRKLGDLLAVIRGLRSATDTGQLLQRLTAAATDLTDSEAASILKFDPDSNTLHFIAAPWFHQQQLKDVSVPLDGSAAGWVYSKVEPLLIHDAAVDPRHFKEVDQAIGFTTSSLLAVPMTHGGETLGVIEVLNKTGNAHYTEDDVTILEILAFYASLALWTMGLEARVGATQDERQELDRLKSNFIAITSHELRTPLGLILGHATFLRETIAEEERGPIEIIIRNANRLKEIIENLTSVDNVESGVARLRQNAMSIPAVVQEVVSTFQDMAASKNITLRVDTGNRDLLVEADANKIGVALSNLVRNAIMFTDPGGQVLVRVTTMPGYAQVAVIDNGIGIPARDLGKVFERFFQVESHLTRRHGGMGLGLSVAKAMIEMHGGRIWVESVEGKGSNFTFLLPVTEAPFKSAESVFTS
ncbi:MAG: ATP-binding protein [Chloroflexota bacterium]